MLYSYSVPIPSWKRFAIPCRKLQVLYFSGEESIKDIHELFSKYKLLQADQYTDIDSFLQEREGLYTITESLDDSCRYKVHYFCTCHTYMHYKACSHVITYGLANKKMEAHPNAVSFVKPIKKKPGRTKRGNCYSYN